MSDDLLVRRELREGDPEAIVELHRRVYRGEYGMGETMIASVAGGIQRALGAGWPQRGAVWLAERSGELHGSLGLTHETPGSGHVRWFVLAPTLRGRGLGRRLIAELLDVAREQRITRLELETFSDLTAAAHIYRSAGFAVVDEHQRVDWGRPITYQQYALELR